MEDLKLKDRLQPSLLERLKDDEPSVKREPREKRVMSMRSFRESVRRDLEWLLNNTGNLIQDFERWPRAAQSVVNYGFRDLAGRTMSSARGEELEETVREAVMLFEPRILPHTLSVRVVIDRESAEHNALTFQIEGELWAEPMPEHLLLTAEVDLEGGFVKVGSRGTHQAANES